jgi:phosphoribosylformimino-5-aminoimidazole carboxamide ribotide isomerase
MIILPAIDIKDGKCVRLVKGDFSTVHQVASDPIETAISFKNQGSNYIHMVDLDGAKDGVLSNKEIFVEVKKATGLIMEIGGGIRNLDAVEFYIKNGIDKVILGSVAVKDPDFVKKAVGEYGDRIIVGIDAKNRKVASEGWLDSSDVDFVDLAKAMAQIGVKSMVFTDISKDGTLEGPNLEQLAEINTAVKADIIASGGICNIDDIKNLVNLGVYGAICGKSIYQGTLDLAQAIKVGGNQC